MTDFDFHIGAEVLCKDGRCGRLARVVVDPDAHRVTDLIVKKGVLLKRDVVLPVSVVEKATEQEIRLSIDSDALDDFREYDEHEFRAPAPGWESQYQRGQAVQWVGPYGLAERRPIVPMVRKKIQKGVSPDEAVIERGTQIKSVEGAVGEVDHVLVNRDTGDIEHVVIDRGPIASSVVLPVSKIEEVGEESIFIEVTEEELEEFPRYRARTKADILDDLREKLEVAKFDFSDVEATLERGVIKLTGVVPNVAGKRRAEAAARSTEGIVDVDNVLDTDMAIDSRVTAALADDPRTEVAVIDVGSDRGIVTLSGKVDSEEIKEAAVEIAAQQPGVVKVIDELEVELDTSGEFLKHRVPYPFRNVP